MVAEQSSLSLKISGMRCAGCVAVLENCLRNSPVVSAVSVNLLNDRALIVLAEGVGRGRAEQIVLELVKKAGFAGEVISNLSVTASPQNLDAGDLWAGLLLLAGGVFGHSFVHLQELSQELSVGIGAIVLLIACGWQVWLDGLLSLGRGYPNMNSLVALGMVGTVGNCLLSSEWMWSEALFLLGFVRLGQYLLVRVKRSSQQELTSLLKLQPQVARKITPTGAVMIPLGAIEVGDELLVLAGETIPTDGLVVAGRSAVNEAMLTGESLPVKKHQGMSVTGATLNLDSALTVRAERVGGETTWAKLVAMVERAQMSKAPVQRLVDRISAYFVWGVMAVATLTCLGWCWLVHRDHNWLMALRMGVAVLVVACPCALGLATPTAIAMGTGLAARRGIVIKGAEVLEQMPKVDTIIFDKTGTLTKGQPEPTDMLTAAGLTPEELWQIAASAEVNSNHPLAIAIVQTAPAKGLTLLPVVSATQQSGCGVAAVLADGRQVKVGTDNWIKPDIPAPHLEQVLGWQLAGKTTVTVSVNDQWAGSIAFQDMPKPDALKTVRELAQMGLDVAMLTGDRATTAQTIAKSLGIEQVYAEATPDRKAQLVADLQKQGKCVAMVGDGINDAPALAQADVGIAVGSGLDIALATADVILMAQQELQALAVALRLGRATYQKIYQNLGWAFAYNLLTIPIATGMLSPWGLTLSPAIAALVMAFSSVSVVLNSLSLAVLDKELGKEYKKA